MKCCRIAVAILFLGIFGACSPEKSPGMELKVAVAANAQYAFEALGKAFTSETGIQVTPIISSSGKLTAQILRSAPYDLFLSADMEYPQHLHEQAYADSAPAVYARGALVCWTMDGELPLTSVEAAVQSPEVHTVAVAQARTAPYGKAAEAWLQTAGLDSLLRPKLVFGESIAQVNAYVLSGSAQLGFTAMSVVLSPELEGKGRFLALDPQEYPPIEQGMLITSYGQERHPEAARQFYDFVLSDQGQAILRRFGYFAPESKAPADAE